MQGHRVRDTAPATQEHVNWLNREVTGASEEAAETFQKIMANIFSSIHVNKPSIQETPPPSQIHRKKTYFAYHRETADKERLGDIIKVVACFCSHNNFFDNPLVCFL